MKSIQIITAADSTFWPMVVTTSYATERVHDDVRCIALNANPLGGEGWRVPGRYVGCGRSHPEEEKFTERERIAGVAPWKPSLLAHIMAQEVDQEKVYVWLDADAWVIRPLDGLCDIPFDVAFTMRRPAERGGSAWPEVYGYLNTGFVAMRATPATMSFLKQWQLEVDRTTSKSDQHAANNLVGRCTDFTQYDVTLHLGNCWVRILKTDEYNNYYTEDPIPDHVRVMHFKKDVRQRESMTKWIDKTAPEKL